MKKIIAVALGLMLLLSLATIAGGDVVRIPNTNTVMLYKKVTDEDGMKFLTASSDIVGDLHILIDNWGGDAFSCMNIINTMRGLQQKGKRIITETSGRAFSAAAVIWAAGDVRIVHKQDLLMFHGVQMYDGRGDPVPFELLTDVDKFIMNTLNSYLFQILQELVGAVEASNLLNGDSWMTGEEAYERGLATKLI